MSKERLTEKTKDCFGYRLKDGSDAEVGFFKDYDAFYSHMMTVKALGEYEDLEEQGLLLRLPCERVWFICDKGSKYATVMSKSIYDLEVYQIKEIDVKGHYFSTEEKAEEKLRGLEGVKCQN